MKSKLIRWLLAGSCGLLTACAVITVNVYFPEKAAKEAYKSLDDMLLTKGGEKTPPEKQPDIERKSPDNKPQSRLFDGLPSLSLASVACAAETDADALAVELSSMPEVLKAYEEMNQRLPKMNSIFASGVVGLSNQGLVTIRDKTKLAAGDEALIAAENQNRKTVVSSMAKAILKINKQPETKAGLAQLMGKAAITYAENKREAAQTGWWVQLPNGRWVQK